MHHNGIMSVLGHRTLAEAEHYTRDADQARLATDAVTKLKTQIEQTQDEQICPNQAPGVPSRFLLEFDVAQSPAT